MTNHHEYLNDEALSSSGRRHPPRRQPGDARFSGPAPEPRVTPVEDLETGARKIASALALLRHQDRATPDNWVLRDALMDVLIDAISGAVEDASEGFGARFAGQPHPG